MTSPTQQNFARKLIESLAACEDASCLAFHPAVRACNLLRVPLTRLAGSAGFASLLSRALTLAARKQPALQGFSVLSDGSLAPPLTPDAASPDAHAAAAALLAELLGLLVTFIGKPITLRLVREAWAGGHLDTLSLLPEELS